MSAAVRLSPVLDRRGYVVPSVGLHLALVVLGAIGRDLPVAPSYCWSAGFLKKVVVRSQSSLHLILSQR